MTDIERETVRLMTIMNHTLETINLKMDKLTFDVPNLSDSDTDSDYDSEPEELTAKRKPKEIEESCRIAFNNLVGDNIQNLSKDIYDGVEDICCIMDKHLVNPKTAELSMFLEDKKLSVVEYNSHLNTAINDIFSGIPKFLKQKLNKLREILLEKYINKDEIDRVERFWKDGENICKSIVD